MIAMSRMITSLKGKLACFASLISKGSVTSRWSSELPNLSCCGQGTLVSDCIPHLRWPDHLEDRFSQTDEKNAVSSRRNSSNNTKQEPHNRSISSRV